MDILVDLATAVLTFAVIIAIGIIMAGLFIMVLSLATGIDSNIQQEDDRPS